MVFQLLISLIPVILFLFMLLYLDSLKLVSKWLLISCLTWGLMSAYLSFFFNTFLINRLGLAFETYSCYVAPVVEEMLKFVLIWVLMKRNKIGFMIDGAIYGFSIGAAFALAENLFYLYQYGGSEDNLMVWVIRGFGTAVMHGGASAIFAIFCMMALNRKSNLWKATVYGALIAIFIHGIFNQFLVSPLISTLLIMVLIPLTIALVFHYNEKHIRDWLELEFDSEARMLIMIRKGMFSQTKTGNYLVSLKTHYPSEIVVDMYCYISLYLELSIRAKTFMMLKENDIVIPPDPTVPEKLAELTALRHSIGRAGCMAIAPVFRMSRKDLWKLSLLE